jgi:hypothetical protein|tara:strand:+ start:5700 stop:5969 length:270 start_codon:yes stop_codon:yes gene_type:complete
MKPQTAAPNGIVYALSRRSGKARDQRLHIKHEKRRLKRSPRNASKAWGLPFCSGCTGDYEVRAMAQRQGWRRGRGVGLMPVELWVKSWM